LKINAPERYLAFDYEQVYFILSKEALLFVIYSKQTASVSDDSKNHT
jgi:hypothetical protein